MNLRAFFIRTGRLGGCCSSQRPPASAWPDCCWRSGTPCPHPHRYAAVALAALGVILALPAALFEKDTLR